MARRHAAVLRGYRLRPLRLRGDAGRPRHRAGGARTHPCVRWVHQLLPRGDAPGEAGMTADLIPVNRAVDPAAVRDLGALVAASDYFADAKEAAQAAVKIMAGAELGLGPIASMRGIDIIKGEVTLSAGAVAALVRRSGVYDYAIKRWDDSGCAIVFHRHGKPLMPVSEFGPADAKRAGLGGANYQKYPRNMYFARAMTNGARMHCPDLFVGSVYTPAELNATAVEVAV